MNRILTSGLLGFAALVGSVLAVAPAVPRAVRSDDAQGWVELLPGKDLKGWKRVPCPPDEKLGAKNPWSVDAAGKLLLCDGVDAKEMLLCDREFGDGVFHVEWRFRKVEGKSGYNGGVYVRTAADGKVWHQAQVAHLEKPPLLGDLFGDTLLQGKPQRFQVQGQGAKHAKPPGEWNTFDVTCRGKSITVAVNGVTATTWEDCQVPRGRVGLQAEYWFLEFRNLRFKELPRP